jgi:hypothetical protein
MNNQELIKQFGRDFFKSVYNVKEKNPEIGNLIVDIFDEIQRKYGVIATLPIEPTKQEQKYNIGDIVFVNSSSKIELVVKSANYNKAENQWYYSVTSESGRVNFREKQDNLFPFEKTTPEQKFMVGKYVYIKPLNDNEVYKISQADLSKDNKRWIYTFLFDNGTTGTYNEDELEEYNSKITSSPKFKFGDDVLVLLTNNRKSYQKILSSYFSNEKNQWVYQTKEYMEILESAIEPIEKPLFEIAQNVYIKPNYFINSKSYPIISVVRSSDGMKWQYLINYDFGATPLYDEDELASAPKFKVDDKVIVSKRFKGKVTEVVMNPNYDASSMTPKDEWFYIVYLPEQSGIKTYYERTERDLELDTSSEPEFSLGNIVIVKPTNTYAEIVAIEENLLGTGWSYTVETSYKKERIMYGAKDLELQNIEPSLFEVNEKVIYNEKPTPTESIVTKKYIVPNGKWEYNLEKMFAVPERSLSKIKILPKFKFGDKVIIIDFNGKPYEVVESSYNIEKGNYDYNLKGMAGVLPESMLELFDASKITEPTQPEQRFKVGDFVASTSIPLRKLEILSATFDKRSNMWDYLTKENPDFIYHDDELQFFEEPKVIDSIDNEFSLLKASSIVKINGTEDYGLVTGIEEDKKKNLWKYTIYNYSNNQFLTKYYTDLTLINIQQPKYKIGEKIATKSNPIIERTIDSITLLNNVWNYKTSPFGLVIPEEEIMEYLPPARPEQKYNVGDYVSTLSSPTILREVKKCVFNRTSNLWEYYLNYVKDEPIPFYYDNQLIPYEEPKIIEPTTNSSPKNNEESSYSTMTQEELKALKKDLEEAISFFEEDDDEKKELENELYLLNLYLEN